MEGLPVYRHAHSKHGSVYAYKSEIDAWWKHRQPAPRHRRSDVHEAREHGRLRLRHPPGQLAIYACLLVLFVFSLVKAKQMFLSNSLPSPTAAVLPSRTLAIAVLPFKARSNDSSDRLLAQELTATVADTLRKSKSLCVIDQTLIAHFQEGDERPEQIAQRLHSDQMLRGIAGRSGEKVQVAAELVDPRTGKAVWTRQFAGEAADWPAVEDEVAASIANTVEAAARSASPGTQAVPRLGSAN